MQKKNKYNLLKNYAVKPFSSKGRIYNEKNNSFRTPFQRDRDRIIHSSAFRRLKHKTQVFVNTEGDHYRTRLTHSMEVSQISRTLARCLNLNEDLCETLSLAHDLGHPPFGHAGEEILNFCMGNKGGFDHNIQTLRIITLLENKYYKFKGLNLTIETLDGLIKHNGPVKDLTNLNNILGNNFFKNRINFNHYPSLEAQIASISDDIAYNSHDLEDGLRARLFKINQLEAIPLLSLIVKKHKKNIKNFRKEIIISQIVRDLINIMVKDVVSTTVKNLKKNKPISTKDVYNSKETFVNFSKNMSNMILCLKIFLKTNMYNHKKVIINTNKGKKIIRKLFKLISKNPKKYIDTNILKNKDENKERKISDFISGMTDRYAINLYNNLS